MCDHESRDADDRVSYAEGGSGSESPPPTKVHPDGGTSLQEPGSNSPEQSKTHSDGG